VTHVVQPAPSGRAKCRGCGERIAAGELRLGESVPNPFAEGETFQGFHVDCAAYKRPEVFLELVEAPTQPIADAERLTAEAKLAAAHPRLARVNGAERARSGRAHCRSCRSIIDKDAWRISLVYYESGRFEPSGYIHVQCAQAYFETTEVLARIKRFSPGLGDADVAELSAMLPAAGALPE
jgi:hypothetical protein